MHATTLDAQRPTVVLPRPAHGRRMIARAALAAGLGLAAWLLIPQLRELPAAIDALGSASPRWLVAAAASAVSAYAAAALALQGTTGTRLPVRGNLQVQVASAAASALTPAGAAGLAVHVRFLEGRGMPRAQALAAVGLGRLTAAGVHITTLLLLAPRLASHTGAMEVPAALPVAVTVSLVAILMLLRRGSVRVHRLSECLLSPLRGALRMLLAAPRRLIGLLGGAFLVGACRALTFAAVLRSVGVEVPLVAVAALFLAAEAIGALGATPGGLGLLDGTLLTGVVALGAVPATGLAAVLLFRLLTLWIPIVPGLLTLRALRRTHAL